MLCLRVKGLTKKTKEDANDVLNQVRDLFKEAEVEIPDFVLDRGHRIRKENNDVIVCLILLDIEHCSIVTVKNWKTKVYTLVLQNLGCRY